MKRIILLLIFIPILIYGNEEILFERLAANNYEARIGIIYQINNEKLRLDIGHLFELVKFKIFENDTRFGADFFTLSQLRTESNFKFPVETIDYYFGVNLSGILLRDSDIHYRLRAAHISAHLVDGLTYQGNMEPLPFVFSREFVELTFAKYFSNFRLYGGLSYLYSTKPKTPGPMSFHFGFDDRITITNLLSIKFGFHFLLNAIDGNYIGNNSAMAGIDFNIQNKTGLFLGFQYYNGNNLHGQFFDERDKFLGLGIEFLY